MSRLATAMMIVPVILMTGCDFEELAMDTARHKEDFHYSFALKSGGRLELENFNGSVEITGWDKETVEIDGTKYAPSEDSLRQLKIDIVNTPDSIRIRAVRPSDRRWNMGAKFVIQAPRKVIIDRVTSSNGGVRLNQLDGNANVRTSNGSVRLSEVNGNVEVHTSNGGIELERFHGGAVLGTSNGGIRGDGIRGNVEARTSNGGIDLTVAEVESGRPIKLTSSNGRVRLALGRWKNNDVIVDTSNSSITIQLPGDVDARVKASTSNGSIQSDFPVTMQGAINKHRMDGVIGKGGPLLDLTTSNGSVRIQRGSAGS